MENPRAPDLPTMELLEREHCLAHLTEWLGAAPTRGGCIALVSGEAGIGKTVLLQEFSKQQHETRVLWGACDALFTPRPLGPLYDIARQTKGALLAALSAGGSRDAIFTAALDELERPKSLVIFEDMHWADDATLDLLKYLSRRIQRTHAMLVVTYRDDEVGVRHPLRLAIGDLPASTRRMSLSPLSEDAVAQLARRMGRPSKGLHEITGGNPFFVTEALAADADIVPPTVRDAVLSRAATLDPAAREIAEFLSVIPGKTEAWLLEQATDGVDAGGLEACLNSSMVRYEDGFFAYRHELARRALEDSLSQLRRRSLHASVLTVLAERSDVSAARLAHHAGGAGNAEQVLRFAPVAAARAAAVGAHSEAVSHYEVALRHAAGLAPEDKARLQEQLSYECYLTGQHERAIGPRYSALEIWRTAGARLKEGESLRWLSRLSWFTGKRAQARRYGAEAVAMLESLPASPELAMAHVNLAHLDMEEHETESSIDWAQRAIRLAEPWANEKILGHALNTLGTARLYGGDISGWADLERGLQLALAAGSQDEVGRAYASSSAMAISRRDYLKASRYQSEGMAYSEERDLDSWWLYLLAGRARMRFEQSDWTGATEDAEVVLSHPRATPITSLPALEVLAHLRVRRGDPDASAPLEEARTLAGPRPDLQRIGRLAAVHAEAAWLAGDHDEVVRAAQPAYERLQKQRDPRMKGELAAWLWRAGALDQQPTDVAEPYAQEISGDWRGAARAWQALGCPYEHASLLAWHGDEAQKREALALLEGLGAVPAARALRQKLRAQGVRNVPRGSHASTRSNAHGLTKRETEIVELLRQGLRNSVIARRLFLSQKTVEHHVSSILRKLNVSSRIDVVAMAREKSPDAG
jgi:DNA-binding CsgD family transcriptional regulator